MSCRACVGTWGSERRAQVWQLSVQLQAGFPSLAEQHLLGAGGQGRDWGCVRLRGCRWADHGWQVVGWCPSLMHGRLLVLEHQVWQLTRCYGSSGAAHLL